MSWVGADSGRDDGLKGRDASCIQHGEGAIEEGIEMQTDIEAM